jgi:hypothetical protein
MLFGKRNILHLPQTKIIMQNNGYDLKVASDVLEDEPALIITTYEFTSVGNNGEIDKLIQYAPAIHNGQLVYNLAMGDKTADGQLDDNNMTNNNDITMVMSTVAHTVYDYTENNPDHMIYIEGNTKIKQKLYARAIRNNLEYFSADFEIKGLTIDGWQDFDRTVDYECLLILRKQIKAEN